MDAELTAPVAVIGGGPVGTTLALLLARRGLRSVLIDARAAGDADSDSRLLALSRGSLQILSSVAELPPSAVAPIRRVVVSSAGEFGRAVLDEKDIGGQPLGATIRYSELLASLTGAVATNDAIEIRRPWRVSRAQQSPQRVALHGPDGELITASVAVHAEGAPAEGQARQRAIIGTVDVNGITAGTAHERFTRDGPLALLPIPGDAALALIWCMHADEATRRSTLPDLSLIAELNAQLGPRIGRVVAVRRRATVPLVEHVRSELREHRQIFLGNAAQALHPVAGQGLNLGLRDCAVLAEALAEKKATGRDLLDALPDYERERLLDRQSMILLTRSSPDLFATRFAPLAFARSLAMTMIATMPALRRDFAQLMMFGVRM